MRLDLKTIKNPRVKLFYQLFLPHRQILRDFYELLPEEKYDYRMVNTPDRKSDSPRESLAHILEVQLKYVNGVKAGKLEFKDIGVKHYRHMGKSELLKEMDRLEKEMFEYLTSPGFKSDTIIDVPWGKISAIDTLFSLKDHEILHSGWNLALMDHLNLPRFPTLKKIWG